MVCEFFQRVATFFCRSFLKMCLLLLQFNFATTPCKQTLCKRTYQKKMHTTKILLLTVANVKRSSSGKPSSCSISRNLFFVSTEIQLQRWPTTLERKDVIHKYRCLQKLRTPECQSSSVSVLWQENINPLSDS